MKRLNALFAGIAMALPCQFVSAQLQQSVVPTSVITKEDLTSFSLQRNVDLDFIKFLRDGDKLGTRNSYGVNADFNYYPKKHWGFGGTLIANQTTTEFGTNKTTTTDLGIFGNISYIEVINPQTAIYGRVGVGYLTDIIKVVTGSNTNKETDDGFAIRGTVGLPIHLDKFAYVTPFLQYQYQSGSFDGGKVTDNSITAGINLEAYMGCHDDYNCDSKVGYKHSANAYDPGKNMFGFWTNANFGMGTIKTKYDDLQQETKDKYSDVSISVDYTRFIWKGIGIGAEFGIQNNVQESEDFNFKLTQTNLEFSPHVVFQGPWDGAARNLFLELEGTFGSQTLKTSGSTGITEKENITGFGFGFGYNCFFGENIALTPIICREYATLKNDESGDKQNRNTWTFGLGVRASF